MTRIDQDSMKAVFVDMDGTLFTQDHRITERTTAALHQLQERGVFFIVATGRPYPDVFANLAKADLHPDYIITSNGARVHDKEHVAVVEHNMDATAVCHLFQLDHHLTEEGKVDPLHAPSRMLLFNINCNDAWYTNRCIPEVRAVFHPSFDYQEVDPMASTPDSLEGTHSMWVRGAHEDLVCLHRYMEREYGHVISSCFALPFVLDCHPTGTDKATAMEEVCRLLRIAPEEVVAFGDGMNDLSMLRRAGRAYVMSNAAAMVKEAAAGIEECPSNDEDGVAVKIEELLAAGIL